MEMLYFRTETYIFSNCQWRSLESGLGPARLIVEKFKWIKILKFDSVI
jgi:hypothetical protein